MQSEILPKIPYRRLVTATLAVCAVVGMFYVIVLAKTAFLLFFLAILLSTGIWPLLKRLQRWGLSMRLSMVMIFAAALLFLLLLAWSGLAFLQTEGETLTRKLPLLYFSLRSSLLDSNFVLVSRLGLILPNSLGAEGNSAEFAPTIIGVLPNFPLLLFQLLFFLTVTISLTFYWTRDGDYYQQSLLLIMSRSKRPQIEGLIQLIQEKLGSYIVGQLALMLLVGSASFVGYLIIGLPNPLALAVFAGFMEIVPIVGPLLGAVPAVLLALGVSPSMVVAVLIVTAIIQMLENNLFVPRVMDRAVGINAIVTLIAFVAFGLLFGMIGAIMSVPLAAVVQILFNHYVIDPSNREPVDVEGRNKASQLRYQTRELIVDMRNHVYAHDNAPNAAADNLTDSLEAIAVDLDSLLADGGTS